MPQVRVNLDKDSYVIDISYGNLPSLGSFLQDKGMGNRALVVSDEHVGTLYGSTILQSLEDAGIVAELFCITPGEASKTLATAQILYTKAITMGLDRRSYIIALGGGVVGDLAGFVAATYLRGLPFVQVPTSLLAQVDSSVGGKVAVDHELGKNLIGAFYQPRLVLIDIKALTTLPEDELTAGLGEVIKYGATFDENFFFYLDKHAENILAGEQDCLEHIIKRSCEIKAKVVEQDEHEANLRMVLNFGHTIGHAVEAHGGFAGYKHGEAVAIGMHGAARISKHLGLCEQKTVDDLCVLLRKFGLPIGIPGTTPEDLLPYLIRDKKNVGGKINWILLDKIGSYHIYSDVPNEIVLKALREIS